MTEPIDLIEIRNKTLQRIGRNVVSFQKMEGMLKCLNANSTINGPVSEIDKIQKRISKVISKQPMGQLADTFVRSVYLNGPGKGDIDEAGEEAYISVSFSIKDGERIAKERQLALSNIVASRNKLIHQWLTNFDQKSINSCIELSEKLDDQFERTLPEYEILKSMVNSLNGALTEFRKYVLSGEFKADIRKARTGA